MHPLQLDRSCWSSFVPRHLDLSTIQLCWYVPCNRGSIPRVVLKARLETEPYHRNACSRQSQKICFTHHCLSKTRALPSRLAIKGSAFPLTFSVSVVPPKEPFPPVMRRP
jgi:hypothetical protein